MNLSKEILEKVSYHESIETLSIYDFYEIINGKDYKVLTISGKPKEEDLVKAWEKLFNEYFKEAKIKTPEWKEHIKLDDLIKKYKCVSGLLNIACKVDSNFGDAVEALKLWRFNIRLDKNLKDEMARLYKGLSSLETKIKILKSSIEKPQKQAKLIIYKEAIKLKKHFKFDIDVKKTTCIEWIHLNLEFREDIQKINQSNGKRSN